MATHKLTLEYEIIDEDTKAAITALAHGVPQSAGTAEYLLPLLAKAVLSLQQGQHDLAKFLQDLEDTRRTGSAPLKLQAHE